MFYRNSARFFTPRMSDSWQTCTSYAFTRCLHIYFALFGRRDPGHGAQGARVVPHVGHTGPEGAEMGMAALEDANPGTLPANGPEAGGWVGDESKTGEELADDSGRVGESDHPVRLDRAEVRRRLKRKPVGRSIESMKEDDDLVWMTTWGVRLNRLDIGRLERVCRLGALGLPTTLDKTLSRRIPTVGQGNAWTTSMLFTESPTAIAKLRRVQVVSMLIAILLMWSGLPSPDATRDLPANYLHYRYTSFASRNGSSATAPGVSEFGIVHVGEGNCMVHLVAKSLQENHRVRTSYNHTVSVKGSSIYLSYHEPAPFSGWALHYPKGGADTSNFAVFASNYSGARGDASLSMDHVPEDSWELIGTPQWYANTSKESPGALQALVVGDIDLKLVDMPAEDGWTIFEPMIRSYALMPGIVLDANTPRQKRDFHSGIPSNIFGYGVSFFLFSLSGILGRVSFARSGIIVGLVMACAFSFAYAVSFLHRSDNSHARRAIGLLYFLESPLLFSAFLWRRHAKIFLVMGVAVSVTIWSIWCAPIHQEIGSREIDFITGPWHAIFIITLYVFSYLGRYLAQQYAKKLVQKDKEMYEELWAHEVEKDEDHCSLKHLAEVVKMLGLDQADERHLTANVPQMHRKLRSFESLSSSQSTASHAASRVAPSFLRSRCLGEDTFCHSLGLCSVSHSLDQNALVYSYGQLYIQAMLLQTMLRKKVQDWASRSHGFVPIRGGHDSEKDTFSKWEDVEGDPVMRAKVKWPPLKKFTRGIEKLARVYGGDVSRLVDITRFSLYFDSFTDLTLALGVIVGDFEIKVERVKSRMSLEFDGSASAGYRDVLLNVRLCTKETGMLGCDTHICEVQLILRSFGELKTSQGHERYAMFRDLRAE